MATLFLIVILVLVYGRIGVCFNRQNALRDLEFAEHNVLSSKVFRADRNLADYQAQRERAQQIYQDALNRYVKAHVKALAFYED